MTLIQTLLAGALASVQTHEPLQPEGLPICADSVCFAHFPTESEIQEILAHPLLSQMSVEQVELARDRYAELAIERARQSAAPLGAKGKIFAAMFATPGKARINYSNYDAFMAAQSEQRKQFLIPNLGRIRSRSDALFSSAFRNYLDEIDAKSTGSSERIQGNFRYFLGKDILRCWRNPEVRQSQYIDDGGVLHTNQTTVNNVEANCFETMDQDQRKFSQLIQIREWHPFLWANMTDTYAGLLTMLPAEKRHNLPAPPPPLLVRQTEIATGSSAIAEARGSAEIVASPPKPKTNILAVFSADDYPSVALRNRIEGSVGVRIYVDHRGQLENIEVVKSSGSQVLDEATVKIIERRVRSYIPARNEKGYPVSGWFDSNINWRIPGR